MMVAPVVPLMSQCANPGSTQQVELAAHPLFDKVRRGRPSPSHSPTQTDILSVELVTEPASAGVRSMPLGTPVKWPS